MGACGCGLHEWPRGYSWLPLYSHELSSFALENFGEHGSIKLARLPCKGVEPVWKALRLESVGQIVESSDDLRVCVVDVTSDGPRSQLVSSRVARLFMAS
jgi:hypothetical protein